MIAPVVRGMMPRMDEALRKLERGDDPLAFATALRRAGDEVRARRVVEGAVRTGRAGAREVLDAQWPLERSPEAVFGPRALRERVVRAAQLFLADEDPRLEPFLAQLADELALRVAMPDADERLRGLADLLREPAEGRRRYVLAAAGEGSVPVLTLARARPDAAEAEELLARAAREPRHRVLLLAAIWHASEARAAGATAALRRLSRTDDQLVAAEAITALEALGDRCDRRTDSRVHKRLRARVERPAARSDEVATRLSVPRPERRQPPRPALLSDRPFRPAWFPGGRCPAEVRDELTCALTRGAFVNDPAAPITDSDAPRDAPVDGWLVDLDVDGLRRTLNVSHVQGDDALVAVTRLLHASVGDRVARWAGDEWLVRLEPDVDAVAVAERLRDAVATARIPAGVAGGFVTVSLGVGRGDTWAQAVIRASSALAVAKREGGDRVRVAV